VEQRIGSYTVVRPLGRGGMGAVFEVHEPATGRRLALKLLTPSAHGARAQRRFLREAQALARVRHPGVVVIHEVGESPHGPFLVMDLVEGETLTEANPLPEERAAEVTAALAEAVEALHSVGLLHRDLKPDNVMLRRDTGAPVLLDFGLVLVEDDDRLTRTGQTLGTPFAMSPEQAAGVKELTEAVDVYGLGLVLYMALTGRPPFEREGLMEQAVAICREEPEWPSVDPGLLAVLRKAMAKSPEDRHGSAAELRRDLERFLAGDAPRVRGRLLPLSVGAALLVGLTSLAFALSGGKDAGPRARVPEPVTPARELEPARRQADSLVQIAAVEGAVGRRRWELAADWLRENPGHPEAARVHALALEGRVLTPRDLAEGPPRVKLVRICSVGDDLLVTAASLFRLRGRALEELVAADGGGYDNCLLGPRGWVALAGWSSGRGRDLVLLDGTREVAAVGLAERPTSVAVSEAFLLVGTRSGAVRAFAWSQLAESDPQPAFTLRVPGQVMTMAVSGERHLVVASKRRRGRVEIDGIGHPLTFFRLEGGGAERVAEQELPGAGSVTWVLSDGRVVLGIDYARALAVYDAAAGRREGYFLADDPDRSRIARGQSALLEAVPVAHAGTIRGAVQLPTGLLVTVGGNRGVGGELRVWNPDDLRLVHYVRMEEDEVLRDVIVHQGRVIASTRPADEVTPARLLAWDLIPR
jgi:transposase InsO family protein